ncbi:MAG TPA: alpha/beta hydrolase-fold protein [Polyangium sp.]|nr:alpha/beta hydrolase-fold protein [Polyangium sp.]
MLLHRRFFLTGLFGLSLTCCQKSRTSVPPADGLWRDISFPPPDEQRALVLAPPSSQPLPVLVALHGRGESGRGLEVGAKAWRDDYSLDKLELRLREGPLTRADLADMVLDERLENINASLKSNPYEGLVVACPYTPDLKDRSKEGAAPFAKFIRETLLPKVRSESKCLDTRNATGIDGVSMGGRLALLVGFTYPDIFGSIGALQPAIKVAEAEMFAAMAASATAGKKTALRLVSSEEDPFLEAVRALSKALEAVHVPHELIVTPGPHDYAWNRGPGGVEMLLWHERVLRGRPAP